MLQHECSMTRRSTKSKGEKTGTLLPSERQGASLTAETVSVHGLGKLQKQSLNRSSSHAKPERVVALTGCDRVLITRHSYQVPGLGAKSAPRDSTEINLSSLGGMGKEGDKREYTSHLMNFT